MIVPDHGSAKRLARSREFASWKTTSAIHGLQFVFAIVPDRCSADRLARAQQIGLMRDHLGHPWPDFSQQPLRLQPGVCDHLQLSSNRWIAMAFVVTDNCVKCKYTDCVEVCPVDCFHEGPNFLAIDPDECIDCTLCEPECPARAIFPEDDVPAGQEHYVALNKELAKSWPVLTERKDPPDDAAEWDGKPDKLPLLER